MGLDERRSEGLTGADGLCGGDAVARPSVPLLRHDLAAIDVDRLAGTRLR